MILLELALGTPPELWLGVPGETEQERVARLDAARDILADNPALAMHVSHTTIEAIAAYIPQLLTTVPLPKRAVGRRRRLRAAA